MSTFPPNDPPEGGAPSLVVPLSLRRTPVPPESAEFWAEQALAFTERVRAAAEALGEAIHAAADLGLMREQHDMASLRTAVLGGQALQDQDHAALIRLEGRLSMVEGKVDRVLIRLDELAIKVCAAMPGDLRRGE